MIISLGLFKPVIGYVHAFVQTATRELMSHQIANWVADAVLAHEDSRKRAAVLKQFILVADVSDVYAIGGCC